MILAAGLTPAYQQIFVFEKLRPGEVNRAQQAIKCASGKVLNVGLALHNLGGSHLTLALLGGLEGASIEKEFSAAGIPLRCVRSPNATRVCTTVIDLTGGITTELVENAAPVDQELLDQFSQAFEEEATKAKLIMFSGSLPAGAPKTFYRDLISRTSARVILDASGEELLAALPLKPFCVKPNREELARTLGRSLNTDDDLKSAMEELRTLGAERVAVSQGAGTLRALGPEGTFAFRPPAIQAVNPIGSGDCLAAGMAWALEDGMDFPDAVRFGMAAAAQNAEVLLPARIDPARVRALLPKITCQTI